MRAGAQRLLGQLQDLAGAALSTVKLTDSCTVKLTDSCADQFANSRADTSAVKLTDSCTDSRTVKLTDSFTDQPRGDSCAADSCATDFKPDQLAVSCTDQFANSRADTSTVKLTDSCTVQAHQLGLPHLHWQIFLGRLQMREART